MVALKRALFAPRAMLLASAIASCTEPVVVSIPAGTYDAVTYNASTPDGQIDMLASGLSWHFVVDETGSVVSTMRMVSPIVTTETSRSGVARRVDKSVTFIGFQGQQPMLTERAWTLNGDELTALGQTVGEVKADIRFLRR